jgi:hypothetical protein
MSDRLNSERHRTFVGRVAERELFRSALASDEPPFSVLYVFGPGGVGKTSLLRELFGTCEEVGIMGGYVDARNLDPSPDALMGALCTALGLDPVEHPFGRPVQRLGAQGRSDRHLRDPRAARRLDHRDLPTPAPREFAACPRSRNPPEAGWPVDPGWQRFIRPLRLQNLSRDESEAYLKRRNVPPDQHHDILDFTHGHPLALSLVADVFVQRPGVSFRPAETPDVIKTLLEQFVQQVPGPAHRTTLESCALVRYTTESLLGHMVAMPEVH